MSGPARTRTRGPTSWVPVPSPGRAGGSFFAFAEEKFANVGINCEGKANSEPIGMAPICDGMVSSDFHSSLRQSRWPLTGGPGRGNLLQARLDCGELPPLLLQGRLHAQVISVSAVLWPPFASNHCTGSSIPSPLFVQSLSLLFEGKGRNQLLP